MHALKKLAVAALVSTLAACADDGGSGADTGIDTVSARERHEAIGQSSLPGAAGVSGALGASDSAAARNAALDSVGDP
jgi:hypothetical protein